MAVFLRAALGPAVDEDKLGAYCAGSVDHFAWLERLGIPFVASLYDDPSWMPPTDDGLMWLGERTWPFNELATPAPRGHRPATGHFGGWLLMDKLAAAAKDAGARDAFDVYVERLVVDGSRVVGVIAKQYGEQKAYRARTGVVLTTGGFVDDDEMLAQHAPKLLGMDKISCGGEDGSGIRMAQALGAAVKHMSAGQVGFHAVPAFMARGIVVNRLGQRFINEDTYPGRVGQAALFQQGMGCWVVLDEKAYEQVPRGERWGVLPHETAETLEELETLTGLPAGSLVATVGLYNEHAAAGVDPVCHKDPRWLRPLEPPYAAIDPARSFRGPNDPAVGSGAAVFTLGGLFTDVAGHVLHVDGHPIAGLFAAGRASSGLAAWGYISGTSLGDGTFFGRQAGRTASGASR
jgi:3-oxo-5alpha-steroid 4-dehydrogenase